MHEAFGPHDGRVVHVKGGWAEGNVHRYAGRLGAVSRPVPRRPAGPRARPLQQRWRQSRRARRRSRRTRHRGEAVSRRRRAHRPPRHLGSVLHRAHARRLRRLREARAARSRHRSARHGRDRRVPRGAPRDRGRARRRPARCRRPRAGSRSPTTASTFRWSAADGTAHWVRTRWMPDGGDETLTDEEAQQRDRDYLAADLRDRLAAGSGFVHAAGPHRARRRFDRRPDLAVARGSNRDRRRAPRAGARDRARRDAERHSRVRSDARVRRDRAVGRPDPALPAQGL